MLEDMLFEKVPAKLGNRRTRMTRLEIMIRASVNKGIQGDKRAFVAVDRWANICGVRSEAIEVPAMPRKPPEPSPVNKRYQELFDEAMAEIEASEAAGGPKVYAPR